MHKVIIIIILILSMHLTIIADDNTNDKKISDNFKQLELDLNTAVSLALANNLGIKKEKVKFTGKKWAMITSWNTFVPSISMSATLARSNLSEEDRTTEIFIFTPPMTFTPYDVVQPQWSLSTAFDLSFNFNASMAFGVYQTVLDWKSGKLSVETAEKQLIKEAKKSYFTLILLDENINTMKQNLSSAKKRFNQAIINYNNGLVPRLTRLSAEVSYENLKPALSELENGYQTALLSFKQMIGIKNNVELLLTDKIEKPELYELDSEELINNYLENRLELQALKLTLKTLSNARNMSICALTPSFSLGYSMDPAFGDDPMEENWFGDSDYMEDHWKQRSGMLRFTLSLPLGTWLPFSKEQMGIVNAQLGIKETKLAFDELKQGTELEIRSTVMKLEKSSKDIKAQQLNVNLAAEAYNLAEAAYKAGSKELLDVEEEENKLNKARVNLLNAKYDYQISLLELEYLLDLKIEDL